MIHRSCGAKVRLRHFYHHFLTPWLLPTTSRSKGIDHRQIARKPMARASWSSDSASSVGSQGMIKTPDTPRLTADQTPFSVPCWTTRCWIVQAKDGEHVLGWRHDPWRGWLRRISLRVCHGKRSMAIHSLRWFTCRKWWFTIAMYDWASKIYSHFVSQNWNLQPFLKQQQHRGWRNRNKSSSFGLWTLQILGGNHKKQTELCWDMNYYPITSYSYKVAALEIDMTLAAKSDHI